MVILRKRLKADFSHMGSCMNCVPVVLRPAFDRRESCGFSHVGLGCVAVAVITFNLRRRNNIGVLYSSRRLETKRINMNSSDEDLIILATCAEILRKKKKIRKCKRFWIHDLYLARGEEGEFHTIFNRLKNDPEKFVKYFRMSVVKFEVLLNLVRDDITKQNTKWRFSIGPEERLAITLRYLASGDSQVSLSFSYRISPTAVHFIVTTTCEAIWNRLSPLELPTPTEEIWGKIALDFFSLWQFPNCIGAIDGKHVEIVAPPNSGSLFYNYKKTFSIVLLAIVDANYKFILIDVGGYGKSSDGGLFSHSLLGKSLEEHTMGVPAPKNLPHHNEELPYVLVGDEAFPLKPYLLRPYSRKSIGNDESKSIFNYRLSRARRVVENAFGILVQKFRLFFKKVQMKPENVDKLVLAACALHNFLRNDTVPPSAFNDEEIVVQPRGLTNLRRFGGNTSAEAIGIRDMYKTYFTSDIGAVPWQVDAVQRGSKN